MSWLWTILGALLIAAVLAACITYFLVRPALARRIDAGGKLVARELHGRPPLMSGAASCEGITDPERVGLRGVGVIAMSEQALVFGNSKNELVVIIPRDRVTRSETATSFSALGRTVKRPRPMLLVGWRDGRDNTQEVAFTLDRTADWVAALRPTASL